MRKIIMTAACFRIVAFLVAGASMAAFAQQKPATVTLPFPQMDGGKPLMQALKARHTSREFAMRPVPGQVLSNLLWAADGINRPDGRRTAPSARNWQEVDIYVFLAQGTYVFDAKANALLPVAAEDLRSLTGAQSYAKDAPVSLVYVADYAKTMGGRGFFLSNEDRVAWTSCDVGFIAQNVYLFCASEGLNSGVRVDISKKKLGKALRLRTDQHIILAQSVGYPT